MFDQVHLQIEHVAWYRDDDIQPDVDERRHHGEAVADHHLHGRLRGHAQLLCRHHLHRDHVKVHPDLQHQAPGSSPTVWD